MLIYHLGHRIAQQYDILIERLNLPLKLDAIDQIDGNWNMLPAQRIEKGILKKLTFIAHDILRVQNVVVNTHLNTAYNPFFVDTLRPCTICAIAQPASLSPKGLCDVFISIRSGVPTRSNSLRNRPSKNLL